MRYIATLVMYLLALALTGALTLVAVLFLAGPHGGALPHSLHAATMALGWLVVAVVPVLAGRWVWRRLAPVPHQGP